MPQRKRLHRTFNAKLLNAIFTMTLFTHSVFAAAPPQIHIDSGLIEGSVDNAVLSFKGIPFAAPPLSDLRWRPPQPVQPWQGVRAAKEYGADCMQKPFAGDAAPLGVTPAEDCLVLNVWRPANKAKKLPVMVWIYGGGFVNGGSSPAVYSGAQFAKQGVVFVSFNYRVGRFGFFGFPALSQEFPNEPKGNYGYMDQLAALQWVQRNIKAFGGDPNNVTVFGESAGGASVHMLLTSQLARGLFHKAIVQSGGGRDSLMGERSLSESKPGLPSAEEIGINFARKHGIEGSDAAALAQLRALPAEKIVDGLDLNALFIPMKAPTYSGPINDGKIVVGTPQDIYRRGENIKVPIITGANSADLGFTVAPTKDALFAAFGSQRDAAQAAYDPDGTLPLPLLKNMTGMDKVMVEPARFVVREFTKQNLPAYEYRFSYVAQSMQNEWKTGAPHATEIPYVFDTVTAKYGEKIALEDKAIARIANSYWVNFAKTGNPNGAGLPQWPHYDTQRDELMDFGADGSVKALVDPWRARLDATASVAEHTK